MAVTATALLREHFALEPAARVWAPGRVNIVGEHTDYSLLPVLPMAIDRGIELVGAAVAGPGVRGVSATHGEAEIGSGRGWGVILECVLAALAAHRGDGVGGSARRRGIRIAVSGDLPASGGLSSSSALTVGLAVLVGRLWALDLTASDVIEVAVAAERLTGVEGGTMDQTVIVRARTGTALRIDFLPQGERAVPIPDDLAFVVGFSGEPSDKRGTARAHYNGAVVACRGAAVALAARLGIDVGTPPVLGRVASMVLPGDLAALPEMASAGDLAAATGVAVESLTSLSASSFPAHAQLPVRAAAVHVLSEAHRVDEGERALRQGEARRLGRVLDASHTSLANFGATTRALDTLVGAARRAGAYGARLTGAGFGGWAVAACHPGSAGDVAAAMREAGGGPAFRVTPSGGAG